jgi:hypothetical protein
VRWEREGRDVDGAEELRRHESRTPPPPVERGPVGGLATNVGRKAKGAGEGAAARSRPPKRREKGGFPPSQQRPTVGNNLCDAALESVGPAGTRGRVEKVSLRKKFRFWQIRSLNYDILVVHSPSTLSTSKNNDGWVRREG